jgi:uncharacterized protein (TIGR03435 family)
MTKAVLLAVVVTASIAMPRAQTPTASPAFEVASIRQNRDGSVPQKFDWQHGGRVTVTAYPLFQLIRIAYNSNSIQTEGQIVGGPSWLKSDRFDLVAKANGSLDADETGRPTLLIAMLRSLLEDRFHVRVHTELRDALVYFLALANKDGRLGPQLHRSAQEDCRGPVGTLVPPDSTHWCGWRGGGTGRYTIQGLTMADMATGFAGTWTVGRPVLDRTRLSGRWDAQVDFVPTFLPGPNADSAPIPNPAADSGPSMLSAIADQLGLKLQAGRARVEYLVIDSVERPTPD